MRLPQDKRNKNAVDRFRTILSADKDPDETPETRKPAVVNLPKLGAVGGGQASQYSGSPNTQRGESGATRGGVFPAFWTAACIASLAANAYLLVTLSGLRQDLRALGTAAPSSRLLVGIYSGFEQLDKAHIKTSIPIRSTLPLEMTLPLQTTTKITLAEDTVVDGAHVKIASEQFNIDAPASVTLPAGTSLDVALDVQLPVQTTVPLAIDVPVDIAVQDTDLHPAILSLQQTIRPLLCSTSPGVLSLSGAQICP
jgi:hypothetical protein